MTTIDGFIILTATRRSTILRGCYFWVSVTTMFRRTRQNVTLYLHCLSCSACTCYITLMAKTGTVLSILPETHPHTNTPTHNSQSEIMLLFFCGFEEDLNDKIRVTSLGGK